MKNFIKYIALLIVSPAEGWKDINKYSIPNNLLLSKLYYPCLALLSLSVFIPFMFKYVVGVELHEFVMSAMIDFTKYFIGYFIISYLMTSIYSDFFKSKGEVVKLNNFIVFNLTILVFFNILRNLMPEFPFFEIFPLYIIYVVYRGVPYFELPKNETIKFVILTSTLLLLIPSIIKVILDLLLPNF